MRYWQETVFWLPFRSFCISGLDCGAGVGFRQIFVLNFLLDNCMRSIFVCYLFLIRLLIYEIFAKNCFFVHFFPSFLIFSTSIHDCGPGVGFRKNFGLTFLLANDTGSIFVFYIFLIRLLVKELFAKNRFFDNFF